MIIVIGRVASAPGKRKELIGLFRWMQEQSRLEPGCRRYGFFESVEDETEFVAVEEWESAAALREHFGAQSVAGFAARLPELIDRAPEALVHRVSGTGSFPEIPE